MEEQQVEQEDQRQEEQRQEEEQRLEEEQLDTDENGKGQEEGQEGQEGQEEGQEVEGEQPEEELITMESLNLDDEPTPPSNWSPELRYITQNIWAGIPVSMRTKFEDSILITPMVEVLPETSEGEDQRLYAAREMANGIWIGEYGGVVRRLEDVKDTRFCIPFLETAAHKYVIDATVNGTELRFLRKVKSAEANTRIEKLWVDGRLKAFIQVIKDLSPNDEILVDENGFDITPWITDTRTETVEKGKDPYEYYAQTLMLDELTPEDVELFTQKRTLSDYISVQRIQDPTHPCDGQFGVIANNDMKADFYLGEYTGRVLLQVEQPYSHYLVDFSNPHSEGCDKVWVDALKEGNETRYINDARNTNRPYNVTFKKMFLDGIMRVYVQCVLDIKKGEELLVDYGDGYWDNL